MVEVTCSERPCCGLRRGRRYKYVIRPPRPMPMRRARAAATTLVLHRAAVGVALGRGDGFACEEFVEGVGHIVIGFGDVFLVEGGDAIDGAHVDQLAGTIDDEHVRGSGRAEGLTEL